MLKSLWNDDAGIILSSELILIATILVIGLIVGLVELQCAVVGELSDIGDAVGNLDQSYVISGIVSKKSTGGIKGYTAGSQYWDEADEGDCNNVLVCAGGGQGEKNY